MWTNRNIEIFILFFSQEFIYSSSNLLCIQKEKQKKNKIEQQEEEQTNRKFPLISRGISKVIFNYKTFI